MSKIFVCHSTLDSEYVIEVCKHLKRNWSEVFYYETHQRTDRGFPQVLGQAIARCENFLIFIGARFSNWQIEETQDAIAKNKNICLVRIKHDGNLPNKPDLLGLAVRPCFDADPLDPNNALEAAKYITEKFGGFFVGFDGLPYNPNLFYYEKDMIDFFLKKIQLGKKLFWTVNQIPDENNLKSFPNQEIDLEMLLKMRQQLLDGCPFQWPMVADLSNLDPKQDIDADRGRYPRMRQPLDKKDVGEYREKEAFVVAAALGKYHEGNLGQSSDHRMCMINQKLFFPEAGPREKIYFPSNNRGTLRLAILVAGGIAPGINAVIDGIVQRHWQYGKKNGYIPQITGIKNGLSAINFDGFGQIIAGTSITIAPDKKTLQEIPVDIRNIEFIISSDYASEGGSIIGTSREDDLIKSADREQKLLKVLNALGNIDILYVIGGDGSMKLAHSLYRCANMIGRNDRGQHLSVVAIPKTMDNDILWVWQAFGFLSAVEKAREIIANLYTEIKSNPRLCILQLFGSDSGFVVSHAVSASASGHCDAALIPEIRFSLVALAKFLKEKMCKHIRDFPSAIVPSGLVVMAETAIPTDAIAFVSHSIDTLQDTDVYDPIKKALPGAKTSTGLNETTLNNISEEINLNKDELMEICKYYLMQIHGQRIQGQTNDALRSAGLKIVSKGLQKLLPLDSIPMERYPLQPEWSKLRVVTNEPRHILRAIPPASSDIIMGQRLGTLAVDNAMAGFTDFMISQWLTEFVLVPLELVVVGRKRIPEKGIFWKSVCAKTGQKDLV
jgi:6-phosphofructokinase